MQTTTKVKVVFNCSLERAFKSPMLCDISKVHTGYGVMPSVTHCTEDEDWGKIGGGRKVFIKKNLFFKGGEGMYDKVLDRVENEYWKIEISDFKYWALGFTKYVGEWITEENEAQSIDVTYVYTLYSKYALAYPFHWFVTKVIWKNYMKHALKNIQELAYQKSPYVHD